jgi:dTDP-glucose 4,6-dehydratase/UDP-glucose 4-epimerase
MKILIVGSSGFIGSHLSQYFNKNRYSVKGCDIVPPVSSEVPFFLISPGNNDFSGLFENESYDICINASGSASVPLSITNPEDDFRLNVTNVYLLLNKIRKHQSSCRFLNFSSAAVYGNPSSLPVSEEMLLAPLSPYGFHKVLSEHICNEFYKLYKIETMSLRVFSAFGPGLRKQLFWDLAKKAENAETVELFGTGKESRDFIYIDDLVASVDAVISHSHFVGEPINVSSGNEITVRYAAETFLNYYKKGAGLKFSGLGKPGDPLKWRADVSKLKSIGFKAGVSFEDGVKNYCEWLANIRE